MRIVWSAAAYDDLEMIWSYLAQEASVVRADDQIVRIETACSRLSVFPFAGRSRDKLIPGLRTIVVAPYVAFYRNKETTVEIVRVLDGRRNIDAILAGMR